MANAIKPSTGDSMVRTEWRTPEDVDYAWQTLRPTLPADMDPFIQYFETTCMGSPNRPALFEPSCWNQYDVCLAGLPLSSNLAEVLFFTFYYIIYSTSRLKI